MNKIITVKGTGKASVKPDNIVISISLEARDPDYENTMVIADKKLEVLRKDTEKAGFKHKDLKTDSFNITPEFEYTKDRYDNQKKVFKGYLCSHRLKLEFDLDMKKLSDTISILAHTSCQPEFSISFTVKEKEAAEEQMLKNAAENARKKADILCMASGVTLGELISIDYNWGELEFCSGTSYNMNNARMMSCKEMCVDIEPDDIDISDTVTFVWTIS